MGLSSGLSTGLLTGLSRVLGSAGGAAAALDILAHVGTSTSPSGTGTKSVTGVGFEPKVVLPFGHFTDSDVNRTTLGLSQGVATASSQAAISVSATHGVATTQTQRRHVNNRVLEALDLTTGAASFSYAMQSLDSDGFTLDCVINPLSGRILNHICLGGTDLEVSLTQHQMNNTNAPQSFAHGLSGVPTGLLFFQVHNAATPPNTDNNLFMSIGAWAGGSQFGASIYSQDNVATTSTRRLLANDRIGSLMSTSVTRAIAVDACDAANVDITYPVTSSSSQGHFWMLAIRGAKCQVGTFDCNGSTDPLTISTPGITPKLFLPVVIPNGVTSINSVQSQLMMAIGASDGVNNVSCGISDQNGVTTTNARRWQDFEDLRLYDETGISRFRAKASFSGESVVLTPSAATTIYGQGGYLVIGS